MYEQALQLYQKGQVEPAGRCLLVHLKLYPEDINAHYLLGNVYLSLRRFPQASAEYNKALKLDPEEEVAALCQKGLASAMAGNHLQNTHAGTVPGQNADSEEQRSISKSASTISNQTNEVESHISAECEAKIRDINHDTDRQVSALESEMRERIAENGNAVYAPVFNRRGYSYRSVKTFDPAAENQLVREEYGAKISDVKRQAQEKISDLRTFYKQKQSAAEDTASTIDRTYLSGQQNTNVKLRPQGTNIYTRTYETSDEASGAAVPLVAPAAKGMPSR